MGLFDSIPTRSNGQDIEASWFNILKTTLNNVFDALTLNDISDVVITTPSNGQTLVYNSISGNWENGAGGGGGGLGQLENIAFIGKGTAEWSFQAPPVGDTTVLQHLSEASAVPIIPNKIWGFVAESPVTGHIRFARTKWWDRGASSGFFKMHIYEVDGGGVPTTTLVISSSEVSLAITPNNVLQYTNAVFSGGAQSTPVLNKGQKYFFCWENKGGNANIEIVSNTITAEPSWINYEDTFPYDNFVLSAFTQTPYIELVYDKIQGENALILDSTSYISVPPLLPNRHKIAAQTINMAANQAAYITVNRSETVESFKTVTVDDIANITPDGNKLIIASNIDGECHIGITDPQRIDDGQTIDLQQGKGLMRPVGSLGSPVTVDETVGIEITPELRQVIFVESNGGTKTVTANPQVQAGTRIGQELVLVGTSDTDKLILNDGTGLKLNGPLTLNSQQSSIFVWDGAAWQEISRR